MTRPVQPFSASSLMQEDVNLLKPQWLERLQQFTQLIVGFSGGLDSTILLSFLYATPSLRSRLLAVHINHGISSNALQWQAHCEKFCRDLKIPFLAVPVQFNRSTNIEEEARNARYTVFSSLSHDNSCLLLGHHLDDQAETVLLQLFRGAGVDGLAGIRDWDNFTSGKIARPLLQHTRGQLHHYALNHGLKWIEDESNNDSRFARNYLRNEIMPLLQNKWPGVVGCLARTAAHCRQAKKNLYDLAVQDCNELEHATDSLSLEPIKKLNEERIINVLRVWLKKNKIQLPSAIVIKQLVKELVGASIDAKPLIHWNGIKLRRYQGRVFLEKKAQVNLPKQTDWLHFPQTLILAENCSLKAEKASNGLIIPPDAEIKIKFREGGETIFLHRQTKTLKKLFQEWQVPFWEREFVPLLYINEQLAAVVGYAISDLYYSDNGSAFTIKIINTQVS